MKNKKVYILYLILILIIPAAIAHLGEEIEGVHDDINQQDRQNLPENLQKIQEYNLQQAQFYFKNLSFLIAFLAGVLGILTPCSFAILPAFFAYSFKEKKQITKMTLLFFLGFMPVFVIFGLVATFLGKTLAIFQQENSFFIVIAGIIIIIFGLFTLAGKGLSGIKINKKTNKTHLGIFLFGVLFALGFTACLGPILIGILLIAGVLQNYVYAGFLMVFYSFGLFVPLFLISIFFDKYNFSDSINKFNNKFKFPITNLFAGILLISIGLIFIIFKGTNIFNFLGLGDLTIFIYSLQNKFVSLKFINFIGIIILVGFLILLYLSLRKKLNKRKI